jgi:TonB family protein
MESRTYPSGVQLPYEKHGETLGRYPLEILARVRQKWYRQIPGLPKSAQRNPGTALIEFEIKKDGSLGKVEKIASAGIAERDAAALSAISSAAPFPSLPDGYPGGTLKISMRFGYDQPNSAVAPFCDGPNWGAHPGNGTIYLVGKDIEAPHTVSSPDPEFSEEARQARYMSTVAIAGTVDQQGLFTDLCVVRSAGAGLDEKALRTLGTWKFKPGSLQGQPVPVRLVVQTDFQLY